MNPKGKNQHTYMKGAGGTPRHHPVNKVICFTCRHLDGRKKCQRKNRYLVGWETKKPHECSMYAKKPIEQMPKPRQCKAAAPATDKRPLPVVDDGRASSASRKKPPTAVHRRKG